MADDMIPLVGNLEDEDDSGESSSDSDNEAEVDEVVLDEVAGQQQEGGGGRARRWWERYWRGRRDPDTSDDAERPSDVTFDRSLPGTHSYLGEDLQEVRGRTVLGEDETIFLPLLSFPGVVLVPGQTLPLQVIQPQIVALLRTLVEKDRTFGCVSKLQSEDLDEPDLLSDVGTSAEIFSMKEETHERSGIVIVRAIARGRQRFRIVDTRPSTTGLLIGRVRILSDLHIPSTTKVMRLTEKPLQMKAISNNIWRLTANTRFTLTQYDETWLMEQVFHELLQWNTNLSSPSDASEISFWALGIVPLPDNIRLFILQLDSVVQRLRCLLAVLRKCTELNCANGECMTRITSRTQVFCMSAEGPMSHYVNPGGYVHETLTVYSAQNLHLIGSPSSEHSWFPGYKWTIVQCSNCHRHMGWKFEASKRHLTPKKFWGLTRSALKPYVDADTFNILDPPL